MSATQPTALSAVFRRLSTDAPPVAEPPTPAEVLEPRPVPAVEVPASGRGPQLHGFAEPETEIVEAAAAPEPATEDVVALLAEQPELAAPIEVDPTAIDEPPAAPPPIPQPPPEPALVPPQSRPQTLVARLSGRPGEVPAAPRVARPGVIRQSPPPTARPAPMPSRAPPPSAPAPVPRMPPSRRPIEAPPREAASFPAPAMDRVGRGSLPKNRRLYRRVRLGAEIEINGVSCSLVDISIGGFSATDVPSLAANTLVPVTLRLTIDGIEVGTQANARIVYSSAARTGGRFVDLSASQTAFLRYIVTWRGESVGAVGTTTLLDAITGGPDHGFPPGSANRLDGGPKERWWSGLIGRKVNPPR